MAGTASGSDQHSERRENDMPIEGNVALVLGVAGGMDYEKAQLFAREGAITYAGDIATPDRPHFRRVASVRLGVIREETSQVPSVPRNQAR